MKILCCILGLLSITTGFAQTHDLTVTEIVVPDETWIQDGIEIIPRVKIVNLGWVQETFVPVKLIIVDIWDDDTVYTESATIPYLGIPSSASDTVEVDFPAWIPSGVCKDWEHLAGGPPDLYFVGEYFEVIGVVDEVNDQNPANDSSRDFATALLSNDVGVVDMGNKEGHSWWFPMDRFPAGTKFTCIATVENFGYNELNDVVVDLEILDATKDPDSLVWHNAQWARHIYSRTAGDDFPYKVEVEFPTFAMPEEHWYRFEVRTELRDDECPENDEWTHHVLRPPDDTPAVAFKPVQLTQLSFEVDHSNQSCRGFEIRFIIPEACYLEIGVYDVEGCLLRTITEKLYEGGEHYLIWNGSDNQGRKLPSGIYLIRMEALGFSDVKKVVIIN
ncbi:hypothetical protein JXM67_00020 [candidate division WOR-3 bacterium]|nr:hypothetical protein [candidate division WOR-3 bacterium]